MSTSLPLAAPPTTYSKLRDFLHEKPWLYKVLRAIRFIAVIGPWRPLIVAYHRRFSPNPKVASVGPTLVPDLDPHAIACKLERNGFAPCGTLPPEYVDRLAGLYGPPDGPPGGRPSGPMSGVIHNPHEKWDAARRIAHDEAFLAVARCYLGTEPIVFASKMWWSVPQPDWAAGAMQTAEAQFDQEHAATFHFDVADSKSLILFIYLTDVDEDCGPHAVIEGTHKKKTFAELIRIYIDDDDALRRFGAARIRTVLGKRGTLFFEEQTAYHKGIPARKSRLMFGVNYTLHRKPRPREASANPPTDR